MVSVLPRIRFSRRTAVARAILGLSVFIGSAAHIMLAEEEKIRFSIPPGDAAQALMLAALQGEADIMFVPGTMAGLKTKRVEGDYLLSEALSLMLQDTPLVAVLDSESGAFAITRRAKKGGKRPRRSESARQNISTTENQTKMNFDKTQNKYSLPSLLKGLVALSLASQAMGQASDENVFELSPFTVDGSQDTGYRATSTLAGTRLNTSLRDVASSISVVTKDFLDDTGSTNIQDLLLYTAGTEIAGFGGNFTNPGNVVEGGIRDTAFQDPSGNTRLRGLATADLTRDYFSTAVGFDAYNTERVVINRGANAILFGLGSPAGIVNNRLIKPVFKDRGEFQFQLGSHGSMRTTLDLERVLMEDKLSIRIAGLYEDQRYQQKPAFERNKRAYAILEYRPTGNTVIRVNGESGDIDANRPRSLPPEDQISNWFKPFPEAVGGGVKISHDPTTEPSLNVVNGVQQRFVWGPISNTWSPAVLWDGPNQSQIDPSLNPGNNDGFQVLTRPQINPDFPAFITLRGTARSIPALDPENGDIAGFFLNDVIQDESIFNFRDQLIDGPNKHEYEDFDVVDFTLEQSFLEGKAGVAFTYHKEEASNGRSNVFGAGSRWTAISIDPNTKLPDGTPNSNFGRPMATFQSAAQGMQNVSRFSSHENSRLTAFYEIDPRERLGWFGKAIGRQVFTGLFEKAKSGNESFSQIYAWDSELAELQNNLSGTTAILGTRRAFGGIVYLGDSLANANSASGANIQGLTQPLSFKTEYNVSVYNDDAEQYENHVIRVDPVYAEATLESTEIDTQALILQSNFFDGLLVGMFGWRTDEADVRQNVTPPTGEDGRKLIDDRFVLPSSPSFSTSADTFSWGLTAHTPNAIREHLPKGMDISLHASESENSRVGLARVNIFGESLATPGGSTKEKGFTLSFAENKINLRANWYETIQENESISLLSGSTMGIFVGIEAQLYTLAPDIVVANPYGQDNIERVLDYQGLDENTTRVFNWQADRESGTSTVSPPAGLSSTTDLAAEGFELELFASLTDNWSLLLNATRQETVRSNSAPAFTEYVNQRMPVWQEFADFPSSVEGGPTYLERLQSVGLFPLQKIVGQDGKPIADEIREWRFNAVTSYRFADDSRLSGWRIGGAVRWQDDVAIGFPVIRDPELGAIPDVGNPIFGSDDLRVDGWVGYQRPLRGGKLTWDLQLNVRNLFNEDALIPVRADPDGDIPVVSIPMERTWELRSRFSF